MTEQEEYLEFVKLNQKYHKRINKLVKILAKNNLCYDKFEHCKFTDYTLYITTVQEPFDIEYDSRYENIIKLPITVLFSDIILDEFLEYKKLEVELSQGVKEPWSPDKLKHFFNLEKKYKP